MRPIAKLTTFVERYQHQLSIGAFLVGFTIDTIILKRIDLLISNAFLITYLSVVVLVMLSLHHFAARPPRLRVTQRLHALLPFVGQFSFGALFSGFLIFYSQAGSVVASWPFLLLILALIVGNEFMRAYQHRLTYQATLLFFCLFSFAIYAVPILLGRMSDSIFELSGVVALALFSVVLWLLRLVDRQRLAASLGSIVLSVVTVYGLVTALYFSNILPPIPLALKDIGVYHDITREGDGYRVLAESAPWYARLTGVQVTVSKGETLYAYSSVFAPTRLNTQIVHRWERRVDGEWVTESAVPFGIVGGRDGGYRGYSALPITVPGEWRVRVETVRGQLIGSEQFSVTFSERAPSLQSRFLR